jgi:hypothetical protein
LPWLATARCRIIVIVILHAMSEMVMERLAAIARIQGAGPP